MGSGATVLNPESLLPLLDRLRARRLWVAFSGGLDSTALLLALATLRDQRDLDLRAVHAHHAVHPDAGAWARHCRDVCGQLEVPLSQVGPPTDGLPPGSPEASLRTWRYGEFETLLEPGDVLCTAHHREDQAETVLLAMLRGSGPAGLAAMPEERALGPARLVRPLLNWPRTALQAFVQQHNHPWIEDPGNAGIDPDRNFLRHEVLPRLRERWPATDSSFATSARLCGESQSALDRFIDQALRTRTPAPGLLDWSGLDLDESGRRLIFRRWLARAGCAPAPRARVEEFLAQLTTAAGDRQPRLAWADHTVQRYRGHLWLDSPDIEFPGGSFVLEPRDATNPDFSEPVPVSELLDAARPPALATSFAGLSLRPRQPGDRLRLRPEAPSTPLKQWMSQSALPPWLRSAVPLICRHKRVVALGDLVLDGTLDAALSKNHARLRWTPADPRLAWGWERCRASLLGVE